MTPDFIKPRLVRAFLASTFFIGILGPNLQASNLPTQDQVFTIYVFKAPVGGNHASVDLIFSALPLYRELKPGENRRWSKDGIEEQGVIVLKDKSVLYFETQSSRELVITDSGNHSIAYRMPDEPTHLKNCPRYTSNYDQMPLPNPRDVFCAATPPWDTGQAFTPDFLIAALPRLKPTSTYPSDWVEASKHNIGAGGVLVLTNRAVLEYFAWSPSAVRFENYKSQTYFMTK